MLCICQLPLKGAPISKSTLSLRGPKEVIITAKVFCYLFFSTISAHPFRYLQSVLIGDYSISALGFLGGLFRTSLFQDDFVETSPLVSAFTKLSQSSATLRCHHSLQSHRPTVVGRWWDVLIGFYGVGLLTPFVFCFAKSTSLKEGGKIYLSN